MVDAMVDTMVDAIVNAMVDATVDAMVDESRQPKTCSPKSTASIPYRSKICLITLRRIGFAR